MRTARVVPTNQRETGWDIASFVLRSGLTLVAAAILVLEANGYVIDFNRLRVEKAGLLVLDARTADIAATLDGHPLMVRAGKLTQAYFPDLYQLEVTKSGYHAWHHPVRIERGRVALFDGITLFRERIVAGAQRPATAAEQAAPLVGAQVRITDSELWYRGTPDDVLVTRLSVPIQAAIPLDKTHLAYELSTGIHAIDLDGTNDVLLLDQPFPDPVPMLAQDGGRALLLLSAGSATPYRIQ